MSTAEIVARLREVLESAELWLRDPCAAFDVAAEKFYADTGYLRPGKSVPVEMYSNDYERRRTEAWATWSGLTEAARLQSLRDAIAALEQQEAEIVALRAAVERLTAALQRAEWADNGHCPSCCAPAVNGRHFYGCVIGAALAAEAPKERWQPMTTAPRDGTQFLGWYGNGEVHVVAIDDKGECYRELDPDDAKWVLPDYWMPLPVAPKEQP